MNTVCPCSGYLNTLLAVAAQQAPSYPFRSSGAAKQDQLTKREYPTRSSSQPAMEPQRGEEQLVRGGGAGCGGGGANDDAGAAACLCPAAARGPLFPPRHALEQEVLRRAELQLHAAVVVGGGGDRRRERKMKNRESAARSRARRHAYVSELEKEVSLLQAENEELRKLCEEVNDILISCLKHSISY